MIGTRQIIFRIPFQFLSKFYPLSSSRSLSTSSLIPRSSMAMPPPILGGSPIYNPLDASTCQIRLLTLTPSKYDDDDISCRLSVVELRSSPTPEYEALSYLWGDPSPKFTITVNGHPFAIGHNLYIALCYLRHRRTPRTLWIDALCINQKDSTEKDCQIRQMGAVYLNASEVLVWFGESDTDIDKAMDMLSDMEGKVDVSKLDWYYDNSEPQLDWYAATIYDKRVHPGLNKLFNRPWFSRIWVVQEVSLSQRAPIIHCGKRYISFKLLWDLKHHLGLPSVYGDSVQKALGLNMETCSEMRNFGARWNKSASLLSNADEKLLQHFLQFTSSRECTEPRDRVFGLLGLLSPEFVLAHFPDYNEPVAKIYKRTMKLLLAHGGIRWLQYAKNAKMFDLPSWCIDFSTDWLKNDRGFLGGWESLSENKIEQPDLKNSIELGSIRVKGAELGQVKFSQPAFAKTEGNSYTTASVPELMKLVESFGETMLPFFAAVYDILQDEFGYEEACKRIVAGDIWKLIGHGEDGLSSQRRDAERWASKLETSLWLVNPRWRATSEPWSQASLRLTCTRSELLEWLTIFEHGYFRADDKIAECFTQLIWLIRCLSDCSFFTASDDTNAYYGKANGMVEEGDVLCLIPGFEKPAILRHKQGSFELVGFAYVPNLSRPYEEIMHGDYFKLSVRHKSEDYLFLDICENLEKREFCLI